MTEKKFSGRVFFPLPTENYQSCREQEKGKSWDIAFGYTFGRDAKVIPEPHIYSQELSRFDSSTWNVFFLSEPTMIEKRGKKIQLPAGWWGSMVDEKEIYKKD